MAQVKFELRLERVKVEQPHCHCGKVATERIVTRDVATQEILSSTLYCFQHMEETWQRLGRDRNIKSGTNGKASQK